MRRDAVTSNVTEQVYVRVHRRTRAHVRRTHVREAAVYEATSAETSYSDNCYYRVTGLIRSIKYKGGRSKSCQSILRTIPNDVPCIRHGHASTCTSVRILGDCHRGIPCRTKWKTLPLARDCNFARTNLSHEVTCRRWRYAGHREGGSDEKPTEEKGKTRTFQISSSAQVWRTSGGLITFIMKETRRRFKRK